MFGPQNNNHKVSHVTAQILLLAAAAEEEQGHDVQVWNGSSQSHQTHISRLLYRLQCPSVGVWAVKVHSPFPFRFLCVSILFAWSVFPSRVTLNSLIFRGILLLYPLKWKLALNGVDDDVCVCFCYKHQ